jgi:YhcH/YjgK/YiaL family protein
MLVDHISNIPLYVGLNPYLVKGLDFIQKNEFASLAPGRYPIDGDDVYAVISEYKTKNISECAWEAHNKYTDIQLLISGEEKIGFACRSQQKIIKPYDTDKDILFLEGHGDFITLTPGMFMVLTPQDSHMPCVMTKESQHIKKMVIKLFFEDYF